MVMPSWLETLVEFRFFNACPFHEAVRKGEQNILCLDCNSTFCPHCLSPHRHHRLLQIRRYVYHDVVRVEDLQRLIECSSIQSYTANGAKVVFLSERPQTRPFRGGTGHHACSSCDRPLPFPFLHCSLACKVKHVLGGEEGLAGQLHSCELLPLAGDLLDDCQLSPDSMLDYPSGSSGSSASGGAMPAVVVRKKRSNVVGGGSNWPSGSEGVSRRKGVPSRAPLS